MARHGTWDGGISSDMLIQDPWIPASISALSIPIAGNEDEFKQRARLIAYQQLLYRMFGSSFECSPISGGFSGSSVVKITPFGALGHREEAVIVKLDSALNVRTEVTHSIQARAALGDIAARVLGEPIFLTSDIDGQEYGGFKVELAGAVLQVPELSSRGGESRMINTFKDLVLYECEEAVLSRISKNPELIELCLHEEDDDEPARDGQSYVASSTRPYGSVFSIIKELFGLDGSATRSLRRFEAGTSSSVRRRVSLSDPNHPSGGDFLLSRLPASEINESEVVLAVMEFLSKHHEIASPYGQVNRALNVTKRALARAPKEWKLVRGFSHGDLNGSNIIIDAMEGMWLIDFATAKKLPLTADLAKLETCILFEYAFIPIPVEYIASILSQQVVEVGLVATWLRVSVEALQSFLALLPATSITEGQIDAALAKLADQESAHHLRARLVADPQTFWASLDFTINRILPCLLPSSVGTIPPNVFRGVVDMATNRRELAPTLPPPLLAMGLALQATEKMRQYSLSDIEKLFRAIDADDESGGIFNWDVSPIEYAVMLLRESSRLVRYLDVPPWTKFIVGHFAQSLGELIENEVNRLLVDSCALKRVDLAPSPLMVEISRNSTPVDEDEDEDYGGCGLEGEEAKKYLKYVKAKYGYLIDFVSGRQLDVVSQCCDLRLFTPTQSSVSLDYLTHISLSSSLAPRGMIVSGIPGSGKSFLLRKLLVDAILNGVIPIFIPVNDWLKVITAGEHSLCALSEFIHSQFVDDDARCRLLRISVKRQRCLLLVDGLDDAGTGSSLQRVMECLVSKIQQGARVVITCRKNSLPESAMLSLSKAGFGSAEIAPLDKDQRRHVVKSRLPDSSAVAKFESFFDAITEVSNELLKSPAFLSMLLCYWGNLQNTSDAAPPPLSRQPTALVRTTTEVSIEISRSISPSGIPACSVPSVVDVYRVAVSVLVHRYQVLQEADRSRVRESARRLNELLRLLAFHMKLKQVDAITPDLVTAAALKPEEMDMWTKVSEHVAQGRFSLLTHSAALGEFRFCLAGILDLLSAEHLIHLDDVSGLCSLISMETLVADPSWMSTLSILAEKAPVKYVRLIERKLITTSAASMTDTCVHMAARAGHLAFFKVLSRSSLLESLVERANSVSLLPIHEAAKSRAESAPEICKLLVASRADVWATTADGWCALHFAASFHNREVCAALLEDSRLSSDGGSFNQLPQLPRRQLVRLSEAGLELSTKIIRNKVLSSEEFIQEAKHVFPELSYFRGRSDTTPDASASVVGLDPSEIEYRRTMGAMLSVFWVVADRYDDFIQGQPDHDKLSLTSWKKIRSWMGSMLTTPESVDAMLCLMAIHDLGKLKDFRNDLAKHYKDHDAAMRYNMTTTPEVLPSLCRLPDTFQQIVKSALGLDFNFGQFLQAENLPANLCAIKELIATKGEETLTFYLFHIFADMAGIMGAVSLEGSVFMTETMYSNFALGIDALSELSWRSLVEEVYDGFLERRSRGQQLIWNRELVRLACLSRVFDPHGAAMVRRAWEGLDSPSRDRLGDHLSRTGLKGRHPAFLLYYAPAFMENAKRNPNLGLEEAMRFLLRIYEAAETEFKSSSTKSIVVVHIAEAAELAKRISSSLEAVCFRIVRSTGSRRLSEGTVRISPWFRPISEDLAVLSKSFAVSDKTYRELSFGGFSTSLAASILSHIYSGDFKSFTSLASSMSGISSSTFESLAGWVKSSLPDPDLAFITVALSSLSDETIGQIRKDLNLKDSSSSVWEIAQTYPSVFPSFNRLCSEERERVVAVLSFPFSMESVVNSERLRTRDLELLVNSDPAFIRLYTIHSLVTCSTSVWSEGYIAVYRHVADQLQIPSTAIIADLLDYRGQYLIPPSSPRSGGLTGPPSTQTERDSVVRLGCLVNAYFQTGGSVVQTAFNSLTGGQKSELCTILSPDYGVEIVGLSRFLTASKINSAVGLESGILVLLRVVRRLNNSVTICNLSMLVDRAQGHNTCLPFADIAFEISGSSMVVPQVLIPVSDRSRVLSLLSTNASQLTSQLVSGLSPMVDTHEVLSKVYPEIAAFGLVEKGYAHEASSPDTTVPAASSAAAVERDRTVRAMQAIMLILTNGFETFSKNQAKPVLSLTSWLDIKEWLAGSVLANPDTVDALFVLVIVTGVSRLTGIDLSLNQSLFPSLLRLSLKHKSLVLACIHSGFNFGQFLQGEGGPELLENLQLFVRAQGSFGLDFLLASSFAQQAGLSMPLFMNDSRWCTFRIGKEALGARPDRDTIESIHGKYLLRRGGCVLSGFRDNMAEFKALCRLVCLARITSETEARSLELAFDDLNISDKRLLSANLTNTVVVFPYLPSFIENLRLNASVPPSARLVILGDVLKAAVGTGKRTVDLSLVANWAREVQMYDYNSADFKFSLSLKAVQMEVVSSRGFV